MASWTGYGHNHPGVLAAVDQVRHDDRIAGDKCRPVAGHVGLLAQRIDGEQAIVGAFCDLRIQDARDRGAATLDVPLPPAELGVAFIGRDDGAELAGLPDDPPQRRDVPDAAGGVGR